MDPNTLKRQSVSPGIGSFLVIVFNQEKQIRKFCFSIKIRYNDFNVDRG